MPKTRLVRDDAYDELAAAYQVLLAAHLNDVLKEHGVSSRKVRRAVCTQFLSGMGVLHDQSWFVADGKRVHPLLCFTEEFVDVDTDIDRLDAVFAPSASFSFTEYAFGSLIWLFDEHKEKADAIETRLVGDEDAGEDPATEAGANDTDEYKEWVLADGTDFCCWLGGTVEAGSEFYLWASGPAGPVEYRVRRGTVVVTDWAKLRKQREVGLGPQFRAATTLEPGRYAIDFRTAGQEFSAISLRLK